MRDQIKDLVKNVVSPGFFDKIKITANLKTVTIEAMEKEKEVILKGTFDKPIIGLEGEFGLSNLNLLNHICNDSEFTNTDSKLNITYDTKNNEKIPVELSYINKSKTFINYRFMSKQLVPDQPSFKEPTWDIVINPNKSTVQQFAWAANGLSEYEQYFIPKVKDNELRFYIGEDNAANQRGGVIFASNIKNQFESQHRWKISHIQTILKLADSSDCEMSFSIKGIIQIKLNTGIGNYKFLFPAKMR
jgi:hypothetical protein